MGFFLGIMYSWTEVLFISCAIFLGLGGVSAQGEDVLGGASSEGASEELLDAKLKVWQLLENENARRTFFWFSNDWKDIMEGETSTRMFASIVEFIEGILTDEKTAATSVKYFVDAIPKLFTSDESVPIIEAVLASASHAVHSPHAPKLLNKAFDFLDACVRTHRGAALISIIGVGVCRIIHRPKPKVSIIKAFKNVKTILSSPLGSDESLSQ